MREIWKIISSRIISRCLLRIERDLQECGAHAWPGNLSEVGWYHLSPVHFSSGLLHRCHLVDQYTPFGTAVSKWQPQKSQRKSTTAEFIPPSLWESASSRVLLTSRTKKRSGCPCCWLKRSSQGIVLLPAKDRFAHWADLHIPHAFQESARTGHRRDPRVAVKCRLSNPHVRLKYHRPGRGPG